MASSGEIANYNQLYTPPLSLYLSKHVDGRTECDEICKNLAAETSVVISENKLCRIVTLASKIVGRPQKPDSSLQKWRGRKQGVSWKILLTLFLASLKSWALGGAKKSLWQPKMYLRDPSSRVPSISLSQQSDWWALNHRQTLSWFKVWSISVMNMFCLFY